MSITRTTLAESKQEITKIPKEIQSKVQWLINGAGFDFRLNENYFHPNVAIEIASFLIESFQKDNKEIALKVLHEFDWITFQRAIEYMPEKIVYQFISQSSLLNGLFDLNFPRIQFKELTPEVFCNLVFNSNIHSRMELSVLISFFTSKDMKFISEFNLLMIEKNELAKNIMPKLLKLVYYDYSFRDFYRDTWSILLTCMLEKLPNKTYFQHNEPLRTKFLNAISNTPTISNHKINEILPNDFQFYKSLGRSLLFITAEAKSIIAVKLSKGEGDDNEIIKEYLTTKFIAENKEELGLKSNIPKINGLFYLSDISAYAENFKNSHHEMKTFFELTINNTSNLCYVYEAAPEYFTYLYNVENNTQFVETQNVALHDLMILQEKLGLIFHQLIQAYHGKDRRYRVLTNTLYHRNNLDVLIGESGLGRMDAFYKAVEYPNIRSFPYCLADLGDHCIAKDDKYIKMDPNKSFETSTFNDEEGAMRTDIPWKDKQITVTTVNYLAEYLYCLVLIGAHRVLDGKGNWKDLVNGIISIAAQQLSISMHGAKSKDEMELYLKACVNEDVLARQMQFFMTSEHVNYIESGYIPFEIFNMQVEVDKGVYELEHQYAHWHKGFGPAINKEDGLDLGPFGGNNPLTELSKLLNVYVFILSCNKYYIQSLPKVENKASQYNFSNSLFGYFNSVNRNKLSQAPLNTDATKDMDIQVNCSI